MSLQRLKTVVFLIMVISSVVSMYWLLQIDGTVKSLSEYGVKYSEQWSGPYNKLTMYMYILMLTSMVVSSYGLFFHGIAKSSQKLLKADVRQQELEKEARPSEEQEVIVGNICDEEEHGIIVEILSEIPEARESAISRAKERARRFIAWHQSEQLIPVEEEKIRSDGKGREEAILNIDSTKTAYAVKEKSKPLLEENKTQGIKRQKIIENVGTAIACPSCQHVFNRPLLVLEFSNGKARLINVCPHCRHPLEDGFDQQGKNEAKK